MPDGSGGSGACVRKVGGLVDGASDPLGAQRGHVPLEINHPRPSLSWRPGADGTP